MDGFSRPTPTAAAGDEIVILARSGAPGNLQLFNEVTPVGQRLPLVPPLGTVFKAWAPDDEIDRWFALMQRTTTDDEIESYRAGLLTARRPRFRNPVGPDAWFFWAASRALPPRLRPWIEPT